MIVADLQRGDAVRAIGDALAVQGVEPQFMVNNAGFGLLGTAVSLDRAEQLAMIDLNVRMLTELSLAFVDSLARHRGGILNVGSMAGFLPGPGMTVYYATKAFVLSFSEALHSELKWRGVRVTVLCPGPVPTEFAARAGISGSMAPNFLSQSAGTRGGGGLSRADARPPDRGAGVDQQVGHSPDTSRSARPVAGAGGCPAAPAQVRAAHIAASRGLYCKRRQSA